MPRKQDVVTALCAYRKGFVDCLSLLDLEDPALRMAEAAMILNAIERKLRLGLQSAEDGESRRVAARALAPTMTDIMQELAQRTRQCHAIEKIERRVRDK